MHGSHLEVIAVRQAFAHLERQDAGVVARHIVGAARLDAPGVLFAQALETRLLKPAANGVSGMEHAGALCNELQELAGSFNCGHGISLRFKPLVYRRTMKNAPKHSGAFAFCLSGC